MWLASLGLLPHSLALHLHILSPYNYTFSRFILQLCIPRPITAFCRPIPTYFLALYFGLHHLAYYHILSAYNYTFSRPLTTHSLAPGQFCGYASLGLLPQPLAPHLHILSPYNYTFSRLYCSYASLFLLLHSLGLLV